MNRYFSVDQPDSRLLFSMAHDGSSWEGFIFLSLPPEAKAGEQDRLLGVEFHWWYKFSLQKQPW